MLFPASPLSRLPRVAIFDRVARLASVATGNIGLFQGSVNVADFRKLAMAAILADGKVDEAEVKVLGKELKGEDGKITDDGLQFLLDLRGTAQRKAKAKKEELTEAFEKFFFKVVTDTVLKDGKIDKDEVAWLRKSLFADKKIDDREYKLLTDLQKKAKTRHADFETLVKDCEALRAKAKK